MSWLCMTPPPLNPRSNEKTNKQIKQALFFSFRNCLVSYETILLLKQQLHLQVGRTRHQPRHGGDGVSEDLAQHVLLVVPAAVLFIFLDPSVAVHPRRRTVRSRRCDFNKKNFEKKFVKSH